jgi:ATP-binding cassette subfamily F protein 3
MSIITVQNLSKSYGAQDVLSDISAAIPTDARIALVGKNGIGKTTLLRLIVGLEDPDQGRVHRAKRLHIGYLPQEASYSRSKKQYLDHSLWNSSLEAFGDLVEQEAELENLATQMATASQSEKLLKKYGILQEAFEEAGGYTYPHRIRQVLNGFGFSPFEYGKSLKDFSGGERTRAFFARLLLETPSLLVLDEPTNHLDIRAVEWLESWLRDWTGAVIIVSHDRYFLDRTVNTIWELGLSGISSYRGNYSAYLEQRQHRRAHQQSRFKTQQEFIHKEEEYIRRNIAGQNTRQAQGRRKRLQRMLRDQKIDRPIVDKDVRIDFGKTKRSGNIILETNSLSVRHPAQEETLFELPDLVLTRGERVVLMGPNGSGKTTFLKTLMGEVESYEGKFKLGASLEIGYFAQAHEDLNPDLTVIEEAMGASKLKEREARNFLGSFLFSGDDVFKTVDTLSGGERGRLALVKLILQGANLLLLDEPTNHLDIPSQEVLESALLQFPETIFMVSHDRYLIDRIATQLWVIDPSKKLLSIFKGGYSEYAAAQVRSLSSDPIRKVTEKRSTPKKSRSIEGISLDTIEEKVVTIEEELMEISAQLMVAGQDYKLVRELSERYAQLEQDLQRYLEVWERFASSKDGA